MNDDLDVAGSHTLSQLCQDPVEHVSGEDHTDTSSAASINTPRRRNDGGVDTSTWSEPAV